MAGAAVHRPVTPVLAECPVLLPLPFTDQGAPGLRAAFEAVSRERFVPDRVWLDIDPSLTGQARQLPTDGGWQAEVITGDGEQGHRAGAPYAGGLATDSVYRVPPAWPHQLCAGGDLVVPVATPFHTDVLLRLVADGKGGAEGRFVGAVAFMRLRGQRAPGPWSAYGWGRLPDRGMTLSTDGAGQRASG